MMKPIVNIVVILFILLGFSTDQVFHLALVDHMIDANGRTIHVSDHEDSSSESATAASISQECQWWHFKKQFQFDPLKVIQSIEITENKLVASNMPSVHFLAFALLFLSPSRSPNFN